MAVRNRCRNTTLLERPELSGQQGSAQRAAPGKEGREARLRGLRAAVHRSVRAFIAEARQLPDRPQLELTRASYDADELLAAIDVLLDDRLTMGPRVAAFEEEWCRDLPADFAVMVNSGSSANLLAFSALSFPEIPGHLQPGDEVIIPAVAWSTSLFPIVQMGCIPVLVDIDLDTLNIDVDAVWQAITPRTRALMLVHLLGNPCDMGRLMDIAQEHRLWVIEDCCEAHGASIRGQRVGTFGDLATFSFYFSHHMTSIEGGIICGHNRQTWHDLMISMRAHGWIRGRSDAEDWARQFPDIDPRWLFVTLGYNLRPTEINAAFAQAQLAKLPEFVSQRHAIRRHILEGLEPYQKFFGFQRHLEGHIHSAFGLSIVLRDNAPFTREIFQNYLESKGIQTRPIVGSNLARQPVMQYIPHRIVDQLLNADIVHFRGIMIGNHHNVTKSQEDFLIKTIKEFLESIP